MDRVPNPERNKELSAKYAIEYFPSVLLMNSAGEEFMRTSNIGVGATEYVEHIKTSATKARQALVMAQALKQKYAKADDKAAVVREAVVALKDTPEGASAGSTLAEIVRQGIVLDPENKTGLKKDSLVALVMSGVSSPGENALAIEMDPKNELGLLETVVSKEYQGIQGPEGVTAFLAHAQTLFDCGKIHDVSKVSMVFAVTAYFEMNENGNAEKAKIFAEKALALGSLPENVIPMMNQIISGEAEAESEEDGQ